MATKKIRKGKIKFKLTPVTITFIVLGVILAIAAVLTGAPQVAKFAGSGYVEVSTPFALNAWVKYDGNWAPCNQFDGGTTWANGFCQGRNYSSSTSCYYQWADARWKPAGTPQNPIKGVATSAGGAMTKVRCATVVADTTPPVVKIAITSTSPKVGDTVIITATATDASGIKNITINSSPASKPVTCVNSPCSIKVTFTKAGNYLYSAEAYDNACIKPGSGGISFWVSNATNITFPTVSLSANPSTIYPGYASKLIWNSTGATSCKASWTLSTATSGTQVVSPIIDTNYDLFCTNAGGGAVTSVTVKILKPT